MNDMSILKPVPMPPLPAVLAQAMDAQPAGLPKRDRTRRQLLEAALRVISARGVAGTTVQEIAAVAGMANGTVYNHFTTKEEVVRAVALWLAETLCRRISDSVQRAPEGAERMAVGNRRYLWLAEQSPAWALLLLDVAAAEPITFAEVQAFVVADLKLGIKQKAFRIASEAAALDLIGGTITQAMRSVAFGVAPPGHGVAVTASVLRGLGMPYEEALAVAKRPLPEFPPMAAEEPAPPAARRRKA